MLREWMFQRLLHELEVKSEDVRADMHCSVLTATTSATRRNAPLFSLSAQEMRAPPAHHRLYRRMTDRFATAIFERLYVPRPGPSFDVDQQPP